MDIQKENDLIQEAFEVEVDEIGFCLDQKWGDYENPYENSDTALAFNLFKKGWQAKSQAVPEGFVLVPKEKIESLVDELHVAFKSNLHLTTGELLPLQQDFQLMIEAQEPAND